MVFFVFIALALLFWFLSSIIEFVIDIVFGSRIKDELKQQMPIYEQEYIERRKEINAIDSNFFKTLAKTFSTTSCSEKEYIEDRLKREYKSTLESKSYLISFFLCLGLGVLVFTMPKESEKVKGNINREVSQIDKEVPQITNVRPCPRTHDLVNDKCVLKNYTALDIKQRCRHCEKHYNCLIKHHENWLKGIRPSGGGIACYNSKAELYSDKKCTELMEFLETKFINKKSKDIYFGISFENYPNLYKLCTDKEKQRCTSDHCKKNNPSGYFDVPTDECSSKNQIQGYRFRKDILCGDLQKGFFKLD